MKTSTFALVTIIICLFLGYFFHNELNTVIPKTVTAESIYTTTAHSKSSFGNGMGYFSVDQSPGKVSVKPLSVIHKIITESCAAEHWYVTSVTPCGAGVMINGEICYSAVLITYTPIPITISRDVKKSF